MTQIVESHAANSVRFKEVWKCRSKVSGSHSFTHLIDKHIAVIIVVVAVTTNPFIDFLCLPYLHEVFFELTNKRQCAHTGFGFCRILFKVNFFTVNIDSCDRTLYGDRSSFKINGIPF